MYVFKRPRSMTTKESLMSNTYPVDQFTFIEQKLQIGRKLTVKYWFGSSSHRAKVISGSEHSQIQRLKTAGVL